MPKTHKWYFVLATIWTILIISLSLVSLDKAPKVHVSGLDKVVHAMFYFVFVTLWTLAWKNKHQVKILAIALVLGGFIELIQGVMHQHRSADWYDFLANSLGAILAFLLVNKIILLLKRFHLYN